MKRTSKAVREMLRCPEAPFDFLVRTLSDNREPNRPPPRSGRAFVPDDGGSARMAARDLLVESIYLTRDSAMFN